MSAPFPSAPSLSVSGSEDAGMAGNGLPVLEGHVQPDGHLVLPPHLMGAPVRILDPAGQLVWASFSSGRRKDGVLLPTGVGTQLRVQVRTPDGWTDCRLTFA